MDWSLNCLDQGDLHKMCLYFFTNLNKHLLMTYRNIFRNNRYQKLLFISIKYTKENLTQSTWWYYIYTSRWYFDFQDTFERQCWIAGRFSWSPVVESIWWSLIILLIPPVGKSFHLSKEISYHLLKRTRKIPFSSLTSTRFTFVVFI